MNRQERRSISKDNERIDVTGIVVHFKNGQYVNLDISKVQVVDKFTGRSLFDEVLEPVKFDSAKNGEAFDTQVKPTTPHQEFKDEPDKHVYAVEFETPEGTMIFSKNGDWSGVKRK